MENQIGPPLANPPKVRNGNNQIKSLNLAVQVEPSDVSVITILNPSTDNSVNNLNQPNNLNFNTVKSPPHTPQRTQSLSNNNNDSNLSSSTSTCSSESNNSSLRSSNNHNPIDSPLGQVNNNNVMITNRNGANSEWWKQVNLSPVTDIPSYNFSPFYKSNNSSNNLHRASAGSTGPSLNIQTVNLNGVGVENISMPNNNNNMNNAPFSSPSNKRITKGAKLDLALASSEDNDKDKLKDDLDILNNSNNGNGSNENKNMLMSPRHNVNVISPFKSNSSPASFMRPRNTNTNNANNNNSNNKEGNEEKESQSDSIEESTNNNNNGSNNNPLNRRSPTRFSSPLPPSCSNSSNANNSNSSSHSSNLNSGVHSSYSSHPYFQSTPMSHRGSSYSPSGLSLFPCTPNPLLPPGSRFTTTPSSHFQFLSSPSRHLNSATSLFSPHANSFSQLNLFPPPSTPAPASGVGIGDHRVISMESSNMQPHDNLVDLASPRPSGQSIESNRDSHSHLRDRERERLRGVRFHDDTSISSTLNTTAAPIPSASAITNNNPTGSSQPSQIQTSSNGRPPTHGGKRMMPEPRDDNDLHAPSNTNSSNSHSHSHSHSRASSKLDDTEESVSEEVVPRSRVKKSKNNTDHHYDEESEETDENENNENEDDETNASDPHDEEYNEKSSHSVTSSTGSHRKHHSVYDYKTLPHRRSKSLNPNISSNLSISAPVILSHAALQSSRDNNLTNGASSNKPCNCKKSRCLKLYCECFARGAFCSDCNCNQCCNIPKFVDLRDKARAATIERDPNAFARRDASGLVVVTGDSIVPVDSGFAASGNLTSGSGGAIVLSSAAAAAVAAKGCHCKKSECLKKYCECFQAKIACTDRCKCVGCKNTNHDHLLHEDDRGTAGSTSFKKSNSLLSSQLNGSSPPIAVGPHGSSLLNGLHPSLSKKHSPLILPINSNNSPLTLTPQQPIVHSPAAPLPPQANSGGSNVVVDQSNQSDQVSSLGSLGSPPGSAVVLSIQGGQGGTNNMASYLGKRPLMLSTSTVGYPNGMVSSGKTSTQLVSPSMKKQKFEIQQSQSQLSQGSSVPSALSPTELNPLSLNHIPESEAGVVGPGPGAPGPANIQTVSV